MWETTNTQRIFVVNTVRVLQTSCNYLVDPATTEYGFYSDFSLH